jgi:hypothetical protein
MQQDQDTEQILDVLRPFAANWSGSLGRGDLVIPRQEIPRLVEGLRSACAGSQGEVSDADVFEVLNAARRSPSIQDQVAALRRAFRLFKRSERDSAQKT